MNSVPTRYRASFERRIKALKEAVPVEQYATEITNLEKFGGTLRGPCPVHGGGNPTSFSVRPETGRAHCFSCGFDGDILDLFTAAENYAEDEKAFAVQALADRYNVELPQRPQRWHDKETRHFRWREEAERVRAEVLRRRLFRLLILPTIDKIEYEEERRTELERAWAEWSSVDGRLFITAAGSS